MKETKPKIDWKKNLVVSIVYQVLYFVIVLSLYSYVNILAIIINTSINFLALLGFLCLYDLYDIGRIKELDRGKE